MSLIFIWRGENVYFVGNDFVAALFEIHGVLIIK